MSRGGWGVSEAISSNCGVSFAKRCWCGVFIHPFLVSVFDNITHLQSIFHDFSFNLIIIIIKFYTKLNYTILFKLLHNLNK